jgi:hypothetical protein
MQTSISETPAQQQERLFSSFLSKLSEQQKADLVRPFQDASISDPDPDQTMAKSGDLLRELLENNSELNGAFEVFVGKFAAIVQTHMSSSGTLSVVGANQDPETYLQDNLIAAIVLRLAKTHHHSKTASLPTPEGFLKDNSIFLN